MDSRFFDSGAHNLRTGINTKSQTVIIGAGVIGICCAYYLAARGRRVTVLEQGEIASGASFGNAGSIAPGLAPLNSPGLSIPKLFKMLSNSRSPLYIQPRVDFELASWFWAFRRYCTAEHLQHCMNILLPLGTATRELFTELVVKASLDCEFRSEGYLEIFRSEQAFAAATDKLKTGRYSQQFRNEVLSSDALLDREPSIHPQAKGAIAHPDAASCNPLRFVSQLAQHCQELGVCIHTHSPVIQFSRSNDQGWIIQTEQKSYDASELVLASGIHTQSIAKNLGLYLPLQAAKGYHRNYNYDQAPRLHNPCLFSESSVFCTPFTAGIRLAGTLEFSGVNHTMREDRLDQLSDAAKQYLRPANFSRIDSEWCGIRPCFPDGLPMVGHVPDQSGLFIATGHAMMGLSLGPVTGKLISELIVDRSTFIDIEALRVNRF